MLGAIIGDIVGSRFEFNPTNDYNFELFTAECSFTDDSICTFAIADALLHDKDYGETLHEWCRLYPHPKGSYGGRFAQWIQSDHPQPYGSFGNGSAMNSSHRFRLYGLGFLDAVMPIVNSSFPLEYLSQSASAPATISRLAWSNPQCGKS